MARMRADKSDMGKPSTRSQLLHPFMTSLSDLVAQREQEIYQRFEAQLAEKDEIIAEKTAEVNEIMDAMRVIREDFIYNYKLVQARDKELQDLESRYESLTRSHGLVCATAKSEIEIVRRELVARAEATAREAEAFVSAATSRLNAERESLQAATRASEERAKEAEERRRGEEERRRAAEEREHAGEASLTQSRRRVEQLEGELAAAVSSSASTRAVCDSELARLRSELQELSSAAAESDGARLEALHQYAAVMEDVRRVEGDAAHAHTTLRALKEEREATLSKLAALESELAAAGVTIRSLTSERDTLSELVRSTGTRCADVEAREGQERARANEAEGGRREAEGKASALAHQLSAAEHRIASLEHELTVTADAASARVWATVGGLTEAKTAAEVECVRLRGEVTELKQRMREREEEDMEGRERSKREREREEEKERKEKLQREEEARVLKSLVEGLREQLDGAVASAASSRHVHDAELSQAIAVAEAATAAAVAAKEAQSRTESVCKGLEDKIGMLTADLQAARVASAVLAREKGRQGARSLTRQMVPSPGAFSDDMGPASPGPALWMSGPLSGSFDAADSPPVHPTFTTTADAQQQPYVPMTAQEALLNPASLHMECVEQQRRFEGIIAEMRKDMEGAAATIRRLTVERDKLLEQSNILHAKLRRLAGLSSGVGPTGYEYPSINEVAVAMRSPPAPPPAPSVPVSPPPVSVPSRSPPRSRRSPKVRVSPPPVTVGNQFLADEDIGVVGKALTNQESAEPPVLTGVVKPSERRSAQKESQRRIARVKATLDEKRRVWSGGH